jgi:hypothetical protein
MNRRLAYLSLDLAGGAAGCLLLVPALELLGTINTLLLAAARRAPGDGGRGQPDHRP